MSDVRSLGPQSTAGRSYRRGDTGAAVAEIRAKLTLLGLLTDGAGTELLDPAGALFDEATDRAVRAFQQQRGISVDGLVGPRTYHALEEARWRLGDRILFFVPARLMAGDDVAALQQRLMDMGFDCGRVDGLFGVETEQALREFQRNIGVVADGTCGPATLKALEPAQPHGRRRSAARDARLRGDHPRRARAGGQAAHHRPRPRGGRPRRHRPASSTRASWSTTWPPGSRVGSLPPAPRRSSPAAPTSRRRARRGGPRQLRQRRRCRPAASRCG